MTPATVPSYVIDLERPEARRWEEVIAREKDAAVAVAREAADEFRRVPEGFRWVFSRLYRTLGGLYRGEIEAWAAGLGVSVGTATLLNCAYELSHVRRPKLFGCTAGVRGVEGKGLVHVRNLDWPLPSIKAATGLFRFRRGAREFVVVGVAGHVGVLSGMLPGAYSVTINWAPPVARPTFEFGPAFLLRHTLETCDTYDDAVRVLTTTPLSTSVFFTVCGTESGQACVIERTQHDAVTRGMAGPALVQANHHVAPRFRRNNEDILTAEAGEEESFLAASFTRAELLERVLAHDGAGCTADAAAAGLDLAPVLNRDTHQQMVFCPRTGEVIVGHGWQDR